MHLWFHWCRCRILDHCIQRVSHWSLLLIENSEPRADISQRSQNMMREENHHNRAEALECSPSTPAQLGIWFFLLFPFSLVSSIVVKQFVYTLMTNACTTGNQGNNIEKFLQIDEWSTWHKTQHFLSSLPCRHWSNNISYNSFCTWCKIWGENDSFTFCNLKCMKKRLLSRNMKILFMINIL